MGSPTKVYGYIRVSTDRQALSPAVQRETCLATARRLGLEIGSWFQDAPVQDPDGSWNDAQSGRVPLADRPAKNWSPDSRRGTRSSSPRSTARSAACRTAS
jgi:hypothetical protein